MRREEDEEGLKIVTVEHLTHIKAGNLTYCT